MKINVVAHAHCMFFCCLIHFLFIDGTIKSLLHDVCQAIKMCITVLRYRFGVSILGTMYYFCAQYI